MPIIEARNNLTKMPEKLKRKPGVIEITRRGEPVLAVMPWELYESIMETLEIMADEEMMKALRQGIKEMKEGKGIPLEDIEKEMGR
jgi:prevent-host-death family protein